MVINLKMARSRKTFSFYLFFLFKGKKMQVFLCLLLPVQIVYVAGANIVHVVVELLGFFEVAAATVVIVNELASRYTSGQPRLSFWRVVADISAIGIGS